MSEANNECSEGMSETYKRDARANMNESFAATTGMTGCFVVGLARVAHFYNAWHSELRPL